MDSPRFRAELAWMRELVALLVGCAVAEPVYPEHSVALNPRYPAGDETWQAAVQLAANAWFSGLSDCVAPFVVDPGAKDSYDVVAVPSYQWVFSGEGHVGFETGGSWLTNAWDPDSRILVNIGVGDGVIPVVLLHELGHAMGLAHVTGRPSIMQATISPDTPIYDEDFAMARAMLTSLGGCITGASSTR